MRLVSHLTKITTPDNDAPEWQLLTTGARNRDTRQECTVAFVKPGRGAGWNHSINSLNAMLYTRFVIGEETLSRTSAFHSQIVHFVSMILAIIGNLNITSAAWRRQVMLGSFPMVRHAELIVPSNVRRPQSANCITYHRFETSKAVMISLFFMCLYA